MAGHLCKRFIDSPSLSVHNSIHQRLINLWIKTLGRKEQLCASCAPQRVSEFVLGVTGVSAPRGSKGGGWTRWHHCVTLKVPQTGLQKTQHCPF